MSTKEQNAFRVLHQNILRYYNKSKCFAQQHNIVGHNMLPNRSVALI